MECSNCKTDTVKITHTYGCGEAGTYHRGKCTRCSTVVTIQTIITAVNPKYGEGAAAVARREKKKQETIPEPSLV